jgi:hypothetical protein
MKFKFYAFWLCLVCIVVYLIQISFSGFTEMFLLNSGAYFQPWRFVTSIFLHGGVAHLLYNIFALALFGSMLEGFIGSKRFMLVFFATGIFANVIAINFYPSSLGASGAIFGVLGCLIVLRPLMVVWAFGMPMPLFIAGIIWVTGDIIGIFVPSNVGNIAHLSGIFFGFIFGVFYRRRFRVRSIGKIKYNLDEKMMRNWEDGYLR